MDAEFLLGVEPRRDGRTHTAWFDLDCDTDEKRRPECRGRTGKIRVTSPLSSRASVMLDIDGDGDLDIVTNELHDGPMVLVSDLSAKKPIHWLNVDLVGTASNRNGIGAIVRVVAAGRPSSSRTTASPDTSPRACCPSTSASETPRRSTASRWPGRRAASRW